MHIKACFWTVLGILVLSAGIALHWQRGKAADLHRERHALHLDKAERARLETDRARLLALQAPDLELAALRADREALNRLRTELQVLKLAMTEDGTAGADSDHSAGTPTIPASAWSHSGRATPAATLETVLWARLNNNVDVMSAALAFESESARARALALMASLPAEAVDHRGSPERLIALLTARDTAYDSMKILGEVEPDEETVRSLLPPRTDVSDIVLVGAELLGGSNPANQSVLAMEPSLDGSELLPKREPSKNKLLVMQRSVDGWKLLIPTTAVEEYTRRLRKDAEP